MVFRAPPFQWKLQRRNLHSDKEMAKITMDTFSVAMAGLSEEKRKKLQKSAYIKICAARAGIYQELRKEAERMRPFVIRRKKAEGARVASRDEEEEGPNEAMLAEIDLNYCHCADCNKEWKVPNPADGKCTSCGYEVSDGRLASHKYDVSDGQWVQGNQRDRTGCNTSGVFSKISLVPYGVLGWQFTKAGQSVKRAQEPTLQSGIAIVDPAGMPYIRNGPKGAKGASEALYRWMGIWEDPNFPDEVRAAIRGPCRACFHEYPTCICIHVVGPNFNDEPCSRAQAIERLKVAYENVFLEFIFSKAKTLRCLPVSSANFAGIFKGEMPRITMDAVKGALAQMSEGERRKLANAEKLEMCIYNEDEIQTYENFFTIFSRNSNVFCL